MEEKVSQILVFFRPYHSHKYSRVQHFPTWDATVPYKSPMIKSHFHNLDSLSEKEKVYHFRPRFGDEILFLMTLQWG